MRTTAPLIAADIRSSFLADPVASLRAAALRAHVQTDNQAQLDTLFAALLDSSAAVRLIAQHFLRNRLEKPDLAQHYRSAIASGSSSRTLAAAAAGLGEVGDSSDVAVLQALLDAKSHIACSALRALAKLAPPLAHPILITALGDRRSRVQREGLKLIGSRLSEADGIEFRRAWEAGAAGDKRPLVWAMLRLPPWPALQLLLDIAPDEPVTVNAALSRWKAESRRGYAPDHPGRAAARSLRQAFAKAEPSLDPRTAKNIDQKLSQWAAE